MKLPSSSTKWHWLLPVAWFLTVGWHLAWLHGWKMFSLEELRRWGPLADPTAWPPFRLLLAGTQQIALFELILVAWLLSRLRAPIWIYAIAPFAALFQVWVCDPTRAALPLVWYLIGPNLYLCGIVALLVFSLLNFTRWTIHHARARVAHFKLGRPERADRVRDFLTPGILVD